MEKLAHYHSQMGLHSGPLWYMSIDGDIVQTDVHMTYRILCIYWASYHPRCMMSFYQDASEDGMELQIVGHNVCTGDHSLSDELSI